MYADLLMIPTPSFRVTFYSSTCIQLTAAVQDVAGEMRVIAAQLSTTCARIDRWLDVAVDESELTLPRQSFFAEGAEPTAVSPPTPGAFPTATAASTPQQGQATEPAEPSVFDVCCTPVPFHVVARRVGRKCHVRMQTS